MAVKIRLTRRGSTKAPFYRIVVADARSPRDGKFIDRVGTYDPLKNPSEIQVDEEKAREWLGKGAQPTEQVRKLLKISGVL
ncbi:MAG: 30S ribosomal protein S16 [Rubrobacteraceae bacterium]|nr:30S ribosomal protein S16 [Rubrobacter sp.]